MVIYVKLSIRPEKMDRSANITIFTFMTSQVLNIVMQSIYCAAMLSEYGNDDNE